MILLAISNNTLEKFVSFESDWTSIDYNFTAPSVKDILQDIGLVFSDKLACHLSVDTRAPFY